MTEERIRGRIDLAKFREAMVESRELNLADPERLKPLVSRAKIRLIEDQLKEARVGDYTIICDEARSRKGGGAGPGPLSYFIAAIGF